MSSLMKKCWEDWDELNPNQTAPLPGDPKAPNDVPSKPRHLHGDHTNPFGTQTKMDKCYDVKLTDGTILHLEMDRKTANAIRSFIVLCGGVAPTELTEASLPHYQKL